MLPSAEKTIDNESSPDGAANALLGGAMCHIAVRALGWVANDVLGRIQLGPQRLRHSDSNAWNVVSKDTVSKHESKHTSQHPGAGAITSTPMVETDQQQGLHNYWVRIV